MPRIPAYNQPQVQESARPGVRVQTEAPAEVFGGGRAISQTFDTATAIAEKAKQKADRLAEVEANNKLNLKLTTLMNDKDRGFLNKRGKDVLTGYDSVMEDFDKHASEIEMELTGNQKEAFRERYSSVRGDVDRTMQTHISGEMRRYDEEQTQAAVILERDRIVNNYRDPLSVAKGIQAQRNILLGHLRDKGTSQEAIDVELNKATSETHFDVISKFVESGDDMGAEKHLLQNADHIEEKQITAAKKYIQLGRKKKQDDMLDKMKVQDYLRNRNDELRVIGLYNKIDKTGGQAELDIKELAGLGDSAREKVQRYRRDIFEGKYKASDPKVISDQRTMLADPRTREDAYSVDYFSMKGLAPSDAAKLADERDKLRNKDPGAEKELGGFLTRQQELKLLTKPLSLNEDDQAKYELRVHNEIAEIEREQGKKLGRDEFSRLADGLLQKVLVDEDIIFDDYKAAYDVEVSDIPTEQLKKYQETLQRSHRPATDAAVLRLFIEDQRRKGAL